MTEWILVATIKETISDRIDVVNYTGPWHIIIAQVDHLHSTFIIYSIVILPKGD